MCDQQSPFFIFSILISYELIMGHKNLFVILVLFVVMLCVSQCSRILLVTDPLIMKTHTKFIKQLEHFSASGSIDIVDGSSDKVELKKYDRFSYEHVVILGLAARQLNSKLKISEIINYFDQGGNLIIVGDIDTSKGYRKLFRSFGIELDQYGSKIKDHFNNYNRPDIIKTSNYVGAPFLSVDKPLLYQGIGLTLVNFENYQLYELITSEPTAFTRNYISEQTTRLGRITLAAGVQGLNNARAIITGSLGFFSDSAFSEKGFSNEDAAKDLLAWTFKQKGVLRLRNMYYHGEQSNEKETVFNVGQKIEYQAEIQTQRASEWIPYSAEDLQLQFVMLDPWVCVPLKQIGNTSIYRTQFYAPSKEGIYQFKVSYKKPGYTFLTESERVTLRPYKHDEYQRFLFVASPYFFGLFATIGSTFIFCLVYLYSGFGDKMKKQ